MPAEQLETLRQAAEVHDIGKIAIPEQILTKPGPLSEAEWEFVRRHTVIGERILAAAPALGQVARLVRSTHERYDGTGYPDQLKGQEIPLGGKLRLSRKVLEQDLERIRISAETRRLLLRSELRRLYYRGLAEYKTGKTTEAERTFNSVIKLNPKDSLSLFYLGQLALARNDLDASIAALNRATLNDPKLASAWTLLTSVYLRRAASSADTAKAESDYLNAVRAGEGLIKVRTDAEAVTLFGQALIGAGQYVRAANALERAALGSDSKGVTLYLLGVAHSRAKNFPKAIAALESAAAKTPNDVNIYRELGYAYEVSKQYAKALAAYEKGASLVPADADFKESIERVRPFAK